MGLIILKMMTIFNIQFWYFIMEELQLRAPMQHTKVDQNAYEEKYLYFESVLS